MNRLRTDLPLLSDQEMEEWVEDIVQNTHFKDVKTLHFMLNKALESHERGLHEPQLNI